jgi:hypothetical protein
MAKLEAHANGVMGKKLVSDGPGDGPKYFDLNIYPVDTIFSSDERSGDF